MIKTGGRNNRGCYGNTFAMATHIAPMGILLVYGCYCSLTDISLLKGEVKGEVYHFFENFVIVLFFVCFIAP